MADPFSIFTGALTVVDVCVRVGKYVNEIRKVAKHVDEEVESLDKRVTSFQQTYLALRQAFETNSVSPKVQSQRPKIAEDPCSHLWTRAAILSEECLGIVQTFEETLSNLLPGDGDHRFPRVENIWRSMKLKSKGDDLEKLQGKLNSFNAELQLQMTCILLISSSIHRSESFGSPEEVPVKVSQDLQSLVLQLKTQIEKLDGSDPNNEPSILSAKAALKFASLNEHFSVQKPDSSIWTGRRRHLESLRDAVLRARAQERGMQKRFVVYGISGSGKTQLCCKFAQDYRESFWGIFWVDASSEQNARESWKRIAKVGGKDAQEEAGKYWLSNLQSPWLLIIDSADSSEKTIQSHFPTGDRGCLLITSRNPRMKINATVGDLQLDKMAEDEANELLRKATNHTPWDAAAITSASRIARHLSYLPLALVHAGRAIYHRLCTIQDYIPFFNMSLDNWKKRGGFISFADDDADEDDNGMGAFMSFEIIYSGLVKQTETSGPRSRPYRDANELINMFAFLHNSNISLTILKKAAFNLYHAQNLVSTAATSTDPILKRMRGTITSLLLRFLRPVPSLPSVLREANKQVFDEARTRKALDLLVRMSLLSESSEPGSYSIHPLVHVWIRKRLSAAEQALWCSTAADVLASAVKLPPMEDEVEDQNFYMTLLPHLYEVQANKTMVKDQLTRNRQTASYLRIWVWLSRPPDFSFGDAINFARYSRVYMESTNFAEAERLLRCVHEFLWQKVGPQSQLMVPISMFLAKSLWFLARPAEAQKLQEHALRICQSTFGEDDPQTLRVRDALGETYWQQGYLKEAKAQHEAAIAGMAHHSEMQRDRFNAMVHLGHVHEWYTEFDAAIELHEEAFAKLSESFGPHDMDTTIAGDSLAMTLLEKGGQAPTKKALSLMQQVYASRVEKLGEEHLYTLWAACNRGRTLTACGIIEKDPQLIQQARHVFEQGLAITNRNLGADHVGTLMGRTFLANVLVAEARFEEAETEYMSIAESQKTLPGARQGTHRDRLATLRGLVKCYETQGKLKEAAQVCTTIIAELDGLGGQKHPWRLQLASQEAGLRRRLALETQQNQKTTRSLEPLLISTLADDSDSGSEAVYQTPLSPSGRLG